MGASDGILTDGEWTYRLDDDGAAIIVGWLGDLYDPEGACAEVPDLLGGHPVGGVEGDPIGASSIAGMVDDGWYPPASIESSPHSPARIWAAANCSDYLMWDASPTDDDRTCAYTVLDDGTVRIDSWWSGDSRLAIPGQIDGRPVTCIGPGAFSFCEFEQVVVPAGATSIGDNAFRACFDLREITIPDGVSTIGRHAFDGCSYLARVDLPDSVTELGYGAFRECGHLAEVRLSSGLRTIEPNTFAWCDRLERIVVPEGVTEIRTHAFSDSRASVIELPASVRSIDDAAFIDAYGHVSVTAPEGSFAQRWCQENRARKGASSFDLLSGR